MNTKPLEKITANILRFSLFSVINTLLQWWMHTLNIAKVSKNEVSKHASYPSKPKAPDSTHLVCDQGALQDVRDGGYPDIVTCVSTLRRKLA